MNKKEECWPPKFNIYKKKCWDVHLFLDKRDYDLYHRQLYYIRSVKLNSDAIKIVAENKAERKQKY